MNKIEGKNLTRRGAGRPKGAANKTTGLLKDAILLAAKEVGEDGEGKGGLKGYLRRVANNDVKAFASLMGRVLPLQVTGDGGGPLSIAFETIYEPRKD